jgi:hypothetical protein
VSRRARVLLAAASAALAVAGCGDEYDRGAGVYTVATPTAEHTPAATGPTPAPAQGTLEGPEPGAGGPAAPRSGAERRADLAARRAVRVFLDGYLPYSYGLAPARAIRASSDRLRAELAADPPRVPPAERRRGRRARLVALQTAAVEPRRVTLVASVDDGADGYAALVTVERHREGGWLVTEAH